METHPGSGKDHVPVPLDPEEGDVFVNKIRMPRNPQGVAGAHATTDNAPTLAPGYRAARANPSAGKKMTAGGPAPNPAHATGYAMSYGIPTTQHDITASPGPTGGYDNLAAAGRGGYDAVPEDYVRLAGGEAAKGTRVTGGASAQSLPPEDYDV